MVEYRLFSISSENASALYEIDRENGTCIAFIECDDVMKRNAINGHMSLKLCYDNSRTVGNEIARALVRRDKALKANSVPAIEPKDELLEAMGLEPDPLPTLDDLMGVTTTKHNSEAPSAQLSGHAIAVLDGLTDDKTSQIVYGDLLPEADWRGYLRITYDRSADRYRAFVNVLAIKSYEDYKAMCGAVDEAIRGLKARHWAGKY